jgi:putative transposase
MNQGTQSLRRGRFSSPHQIYHVTSVTRERKAFFYDFRLCRFAIRTLNNCPYSETLAYVVMPDHIHWLLQLQDPDASLSKIVSRMKNQTAGYVFKHLSVRGVWQKGFHDHAVRREEDLVQIARYIVANPVRAGLVRSVREYSHWDVVWI